MNSVGLNSHKTVTLYLAEVVKSLIVGELNLGHT